MPSNTIFPAPILTQFPLQRASSPSGYSKTIFPLSYYPLDISDISDISYSDGTIGDEELVLWYIGQNANNYGSDGYTIMYLSTSVFLDDATYWYEAKAPPATINEVTTIYDPNGGLDQHYTDGFLVSFWLKGDINSGLMITDAYNWAFMWNKGTYNTNVVSLDCFSSTGSQFLRVYNGNPQISNDIHVAFCLSSQCNAVWINGSRQLFNSVLDLSSPRDSDKLHFYGIKASAESDYADTYIKDIRMYTKISPRTPAELDSLVSQIIANEPVIEW